ncbi:MAG TPA: methyltransferase domain-containing protein [Croceibacterium sp.]
MPDDPQRTILEGYAAGAREMVPRFEALRTEAVLGPVLDLLPALPCRALDLGAGTGRDAAWLARRGHRVLAVEPVEELRRAGEALHRLPRLEWLDDSLPALTKTRMRDERFDLILCVGVWQHLPAELHESAIAAIASLAAAGGRGILSLRHGPGAPGRPCFAADPDVVVAAAERAGLDLVARRAADSVQPGNRAAGVTWTWLVFDRRVPSGAGRSSREAVSFPPA